MPYKVRCSSCGKSIRLPVNDAGLAVVCLACGTKFVAPAADDPAANAAPPPADPAAPQELEVAPAQAHPAINVDAVVQSATYSRPDFLERVASPPRGERLTSTTVMVAALCALMLVIGGAVVIGLSLSGGSSGAEELQEMLDDASGMAARGDYRAAHQKLRELDKRAQELGVDDPDVKVIADRARQEQEQLFAILLSTMPASQVKTPPAVADGGGGVGGAAASATGPTAVAGATTRQSPPTPPVVAPTPTPAPEELAGTGPVRMDGLPATGSTTAPAATAPAVRVVTRPAPVPVPEPVAGITDEEIGRSIERGVEVLIKSFDGRVGQMDRRLPAAAPAGDDEGYKCGLNALYVYALLQCGQAIQDERLNVRGPFMRALIEGMKRMPANMGVVTYARGIRATALALYDRKEDRDALRADVKYLLMTHNAGAYWYAGQRADGALKAPLSWDNSNSQYGVLGVWSGAETGGVEIPGDYWAAVQQHWNSTQGADGTWSYSGRGQGSATMTAAGTASLFVAEDYLYASRFGLRVGREPFSPSLKRALDWFETGDNAVSGAAGYWGYWLYGVERVGLASGFKYFGKHNWYRDLAAQVVKRQSPDGSWGDPVDTAFALLFLSRGRHPILMNKLRFDRSIETAADAAAADTGTPATTQGMSGAAVAAGAPTGYWANRPRDAANLARYAGRQLERPLNWQVVTLEREFHDWLDSPILSLASHRAPSFSDDNVHKLRDYVEAGGILFMQADGDSPEFDAFARKLAKELFPQYEMADLPPNHDIYNVLYKIEPAPPLKAVTNGARVLILYSPNDITKHWQTRDERGQKNAFQLGTNLFVYATGKRELRNRLSSPYVSEPSVPGPAGSVRVARVKYGTGEKDLAWDPEPGAWRRFGAWFGRQTGTSVMLEDVALQSLKPAGDAPLAHMTGVAPYKPSADEAKAMRAYVDGGGVLLVDACGGSPAFADSMKSALAEAFPDAQLKALPREHPLFDGRSPGTDDVRKPRFRRFTVERDGGPRGTPGVKALRSGKGAVLFSELDVTSGLLGSETWGIYGYEPAYALSLMKNTLFWAIDGKPE